MGTYAEHIEQSKKNFTFLSTINDKIGECWDWQVTVCFYTALHLLNAHIVKKSGYNYISHSQVDKIINPFNDDSVSKISEDLYKSYTKLFQLSRRSRYLLNDTFVSTPERDDILKAMFTHSRHLRKAIHHLDNIISFINKEYGEDFPKVDIKCVDLNGLTFKYVKVVA